MLILSGTTCISAAGNHNKELVDPYQAGSQYLAYPRSSEWKADLTPAPKGYAPFHIEHYGRHGSRWLLKDDKYSEPVDYLEKADKYGKLTPRGKELLAQLKEIQAAAVNRAGELTPLGHQQHRDIARRLTENFPQAFKPGTHVDAKSTVVIRCILSMANEVAEIQRLKPGLTVSMDATRAYQKILAPNSTDSVAKKLGKEVEYITKDFAKNHSDHSAFLHKLFNDQQFVADSLDADDVFESVFDVAVNTQSHYDQKDFYDVFTPEELNDMWLINNVDWYTGYGDNSFTNHRVPFMQRTLLSNIIESADTAMTSPRQSVNLRFGHESIVLPLTILMELNNSAVDITDPEKIADQWRNYKIFMMGSNIQMIFYRPTKKAKYNPDEVLVKVLLNEEEATLPVKPVSGPYYRWADLRKYYQEKLDSFKTRFKE